MLYHWSICGQLLCQSHGAETFSLTFLLWLEFCELEASLAVGRDGAAVAVKTSVRIFKFSTLSKFKYMLSSTRSLPAFLTVLHLSTYRLPAVIGSVLDQEEEAADRASPHHRAQRP